MGKLIQINDFNNKKITKGDKMCREFLKDIRTKTNDINSMMDRAQEVLDYFHIDSLSSGVPVVEILKKMRFKVFQSELEPRGLSAYIAVDPKFENVYGSNKITCVHIKDSVGHKKFALAHELGHYIFDFNEDESRYYYNTYFPDKDGEENDFKEKRANKFAANLLMPEKEFMQKLEVYKELENKIEIVNALGCYFVVSPTAVIRRFKELGVNEFQTK